MRFTKEQQEGTEKIWKTATSTVFGTAITAGTANPIVGAIGGAIAAEVTQPTMSRWSKKVGKEWLNGIVEFD